MEDLGAQKERRSLLEIIAQQAVILDNLQKITSDHEHRIRNLERLIGYGVGGIAVIKLALDYFQK